MTTNRQLWPAETIPQLEPFCPTGFRRHFAEAEKILRQRIKESKREGKIHLDALEFNTDNNTVRGYLIQSLWDGSRYIVECKNNFGDFIVHPRGNAFAHAIRGGESHQFVCIGRDEETILAIIKQEKRKQSRSSNARSRRDDDGSHSSSRTSRKPRYAG